MFQISHQFKSPNWNERKAAIDSIVVHSCEGRPLGNEQTSSIPWLCKPGSEVSCHYYVTREGMIYQLVSDEHRAWHAGPCTLAADANSCSIGIELEHALGAAPYPEIQREALTWLCRSLVATYVIPLPRVVSHRATALPANRKKDPTDWSEPAFRLWVASLGPLSLTPRYTEFSPLINTPAITTIPVWPARSREYTAYDVRAMTRAYQVQCAAVGLDWFLSWAQTWHETGGLASFWAARPRRNPAGIGVTGDTEPGHYPNGKPTPKPAGNWEYDEDHDLWRAGLSFATWANDAIPAQLGRLLGYALHPDQMNVQQRQLFTRAMQARPLPPAILGTAPVIKLLGAMHNPTGEGWADDGEFYGRSIAKIANSLVGDL